MASIPFISVTETGTLNINPEVLDILCNQTLRVSLVSITGPTRSGKSFLMNSLIGIPNGFKVGTKRRQCTEGIYIWTEPKIIEQHAIYYLDCEGFTYNTTTDIRESKVLAIALVLSSVMIMNSHGPVNLNEISSILNSLPNVLATEGQGRIPEVMPSLVWVARDFVQRGVDEYGHQLSDDEYLETQIERSSIQMNTTYGKNNNKQIPKFPIPPPPSIIPPPPPSSGLLSKNIPNRSTPTENISIQNYFDSRYCVCLPRPVEGDAILRNLSEMAPTSLLPEFQKRMSELNYKVEALAKSKDTLFSQALLGESIATLARRLTLGMNAQNAIFLSPDWQQIPMNSELYSTVIEQCLATYESAYQRECSAVLNYSKTQRKQYTKTNSESSDGTNKPVKALNNHNPHARREYHARHRSNSNNLTVKGAQWKSNNSTKFTRLVMDEALMIDAHDRAKKKAKHLFWNLVSRGSSGMMSNEVSLVCTKAARQLKNELRKRLSSKLKDSVQECCEQFHTTSTSCLEAVQMSRFLEECEHHIIDIGDDDQELLEILHECTSKLEHHRLATARAILIDSHDSAYTIVEEKQSAPAAYNFLRNVVLNDLRKFISVVGKATDSISHQKLGLVQEWKSRVHMAHIFKEISKKELDSVKNGILNVDNNHSVYERKGKHQAEIAELARVRSQIAALRHQHAQRMTRLRKTVESQRQMLKLAKERKARSKGSEASIEGELNDINNIIVEKESVLESISRDYSNAELGDDGDGRDVGVILAQLDRLLTKEEIEESTRKDVLFKNINDSTSLYESLIHLVRNSAINNNNISSSNNNNNDTNESRSSLTIQEAMESLEYHDSNRNSAFRDSSIRDSEFSNDYRDTMNSKRNIKRNSSSDRDTTSKLEDDPQYVISVDRDTFNSNSNSNRGSSYNDGTRLSQSALQLQNMQQQKNSKGMSYVNPLATARKSQINQETSSIASSIESKSSRLSIQNIGSNTPTKSVLRRSLQKYMIKAGNGKTSK